MTAYYNEIDPFAEGAGWPQPLIRGVDDGAPARVGRLRAYGNAINAEVAAAFIGAYMDVAIERVAA